MNLKESDKEKCDKCSFDRFYLYWVDNAHSWEDPHQVVKCARCGAINSNE